MCRTLTGPGFWISAKSFVEVLYLFSSILAIGVPISPCPITRVVFSVKILDPLNIYVWIIELLLV